MRRLGLGIRKGSTRRTSGSRKWRWLRRQEEEEEEEEEGEEEEEEE